MEARQKKLVVILQAMEEKRQQDFVFNIKAHVTTMDLKSVFVTENYVDIDPSLLFKRLEELDVVILLK